MSTSRSEGPGTSLLVVLACAGITASMTQTLVVPLLAQMPTILHTTTGNATWVVTATLLAAAVTTPISGRLGDMVGKRQVLLGSLVPLVVGSLVCAASSALVPMIIGRALQGMGVGIIPVGVAALRDVLPPSRVGSGIALISSSLGIGAALSLPLASALVQYGSWRYLFCVIAALAAIVGVALAVIMPKTSRKAAGRFDVLGAVGLGAGLVCLLLAISKGAAWGWTSGTTVGLFAAAIVVFVLWGSWELRVGSPLVDLRVTARPRILLTNVATIVVGMAMLGQSLIVPQIRQLPQETGYGLGQSMLQMGLWMAPAGLMMMVVSPVGARLSAARGPKTTLLVGCVISACGYGIGAIFMASNWGLLAGTVINSIGVGFSYGAMPALVMSAVPISETAAANSFNSLMRSIGTSTSSAVIGAVLAQLSMTFAGHTVPTRTGFRTGLLICCGVAIVGAVLASFIPAVRKALASDAPVVPSPTGVVAKLAATSARTRAVQEETVGSSKRPNAAGAVVYGLVTDGAGTAIRGATLTLISSSGQQLGRTVSAVDGRYEIPAPQVGTYVLIASADGREPDAATVILTDHPVVSNVTLHSAAGLVGTVRREGDEAAIGEATVAALDTCGQVVVSGVTDETGHFELAGLSEGEFTLVLSATGHHPAAVIVQIASEVTTVDVALQPGVQVTGVVRGPSGDPVPEARVTLTDSLGTAVDTAITGPDGVYRFENLIQGEYIVVATGYAPDTTHIEVHDYDLDDIDMSLAHGPILTTARETDENTVWAQ